MGKVKKHLVRVMALFMLFTGVFTFVFAAEAKSGTWKQDKKGYWYQYTDGSYARNEWLLSAGKWYYFDNSGYMQTGWRLIGGKWYYFTASGYMQTGWLKQGAKWYYLNSSGAMATGWLKVGTKWYFFNSDGTMKTGWLKSKDTWYYLKTDGTIKTGWLKYKDDWYFFNKDGVMQTGRILVRGEEYFMDEDGICLNPEKNITFLKTNESTYRKYYKGIKTSDFMMIYADGRMKVQNDLTLDDLHALKLYNAQQYLEELDKSNLKEGFERKTDPFIFNYYMSDHFPAIYGAVYMRQVLNESGVGGKEYIRVYNLATGELFKEYEEDLKK